jgi:hypothetical protein
MKAVAKLDAIIRCTPPVAIIDQPEPSELTHPREVVVPNPTVEFRLSSAATFSSAGSMLHGLFASILGALHRSRRLQVRRIKRQHRHLIAATVPGDVHVAKIAIRSSSECH